MYDENSNDNKKNNLENFYGDNNEYKPPSSKTLLNTEKNKIFFYTDKVNYKTSSNTKKEKNVSSLNGDESYNQNNSEKYYNSNCDIPFIGQNIESKEDTGLKTDITSDKNRHNEFNEENNCDQLFDDFSYNLENYDPSTTIYGNAFESSKFINNDLDENKFSILNPEKIPYPFINDHPYDNINYSNECDKYFSANSFLGNKRDIFKQDFENSFKDVFAPPKNNYDFNEQKENEEIIYEKMKIKIFNYDNYKNDNYEFNEEFKIEFIPLKNIIQSYESHIKGLWNDQPNIFENKDKLLEIEKNSNYKIYINTSNYLNEIKNTNKKENRKYDTDEMVTKIKTNLSRSYIEATNSFPELKLRKITTIKKDLINSRIKAKFNLIYLKHPLYSILSNESTEGNRNQLIIEDIMNVRNKSGQPIIEHLNLSVQNCLDIFRYKIENNYFNYKLLEFLKEEYKSQTNDKKEKEYIEKCKEYIASLILVSYNFENFFYIRKKKEKKEKQKKTKNDL